jgi:hypothetical protein
MLGTGPLLGQGGVGWGGVGWGAEGRWRPEAGINGGGAPPPAQKNEFHLFEQHTKSQALVANDQERITLYALEDHVSICQNRFAFAKIIYGRPAALKEYQESNETSNKNPIQGYKSMKVVEDLEKIANEFGKDATNESELKTAEAAWQDQTKLHDQMTDLLSQAQKRLQLNWKQAERKTAADTRKTDKAAVVATNKRKIADQKAWITCGKTIYDVPDAKLTEIAHRTGELDEPASDNTDYNVPFTRAAPELQELFKAKKDVAVHMNVFSLGFPNNPLYGDKGRAGCDVADLDKVGNGPAKQTAKQNAKQ